MVTHVAHNVKLLVFPENSLRSGEDLVKLAPHLIRNGPTVGPLLSNTGLEGRVEFPHKTHDTGGMFT